MTPVNAQAVIKEAAYERGLVLSEVALVMLQAVALMESSYGSGWKEGKGAGSNNWGAVQTGSSWTGPYFETEDSSPVSGEYVGRFRVYSTPVEGAADMVRILTRTDAEKAALKSEDLEAFSRAMHAAGYYEGVGATVNERIARHQKRLRECAEQIGNSLGVIIPKKKESSVSADSGSGGVPTAEEIAKRVVSAVFVLAGSESFETRFVKALQVVVGEIPDGKPGPKTAKACEEAIKWFL